MITTTGLRRRPARWRQGMAAALLALGACGGGGGSGGTGGTAPPPPGAGSPGTVAITSPPALAVLGPAPFTVDAAVGGAPPAALEFEIDGTPAGRVNTAPYRLAVDPAAHAAGQHRLRVRAVAADGSASDWAAATLHFGSRSQPAGFSRDETWLTGLDAATAFAEAPDGRLFVAEQGGRVRVVAGGVLQPAPFLTLDVDSRGERGLIGITLHPDFARNGWVYLHHTTAGGGAHNRISRVRAAGDAAVAGSLQTLVDLPPLSAATNHNGGALHFGVDGKLYAGVGDNANGAHAQDPGTPLGKLLRLNDDGSIPPDNPFFASRTGLARAAWADGLRNPFTFAVQPGSGRIHVNDVGQSAWEEINLGEAGANYGWPVSEGPERLRAGDRAPLFSYPHAPATPPGSGPGGFFTGVAITGGAFYPADGAFGAPWRGGYFFADLGSRVIGFLDGARGDAAWVFGHIGGQVGGQPVDLRVDRDGALLVLTRGGIMRFTKDL